MPTLFSNLGKQAGHSPDKVALIQGEKKMTYGELYRSAGSFAFYLKNNGIKSGDRVALLLENSPEYVVAYYGILAAGGAVVGLNTATKSRDLTNWIRHCGARWVVANSAHPELPALTSELGDVHYLLVPGPNSRTISIENSAPWQETVKDAGNTQEISEPEGGDVLAAIIYTSGTTGNPKGVMLSHANLINNTESICEYLKLNDHDRVMNVLPFYYSYGNSVLHTHIAAGATIILENSLLYPKKILEKIEQEQATGFSGVAATYSLLLSRTNLDDYKLSSIRYLTQAGGPMAPSNIKRIRSKFPNAEFFVMYGQTEATARLSYLPPTKLEQKMGSIGIAIPGVTLELRDEHGEKVEKGSIGQICATGNNIMLGYWNDPDATARTVVDGWLQTGDLAYQDEDGYFYIKGRASEMIKSGANRISPKEIEEVIAELESVEEVAAVGVPDEMLGQVIKVVIVVAPGKTLAKKEIQLHCRKNLATYKIPKNIEFVEEIPKTASGKVKRFLLVEPMKEAS